MMGIKLGPVAHFSIGVKDPDASAKWWMSLFDLEEYRRNAARIVLGNDAIVMVFFSGRSDPNTLGHLAFRVGDLGKLESALDTLREKGVELEDPGDEIGPVSPGSANLGLWFRDPDGYRWELYVPASD
jgi:catechol 2,3-dioxygenase-like lactoylglutathione lyase family enzyme